MNIFEAYQLAIIQYLKFWSMIPLWVTIPLTFLVAWFTWFKYKAPQRIARMWGASFIAIWFSGRKDIVSNIPAITAWANKEIDLALKGKLNPEECPNPVYNEKHEKPTDESIGRILMR